jgi:hypothetical protein
MAGIIDPDEELVWGSYDVGGGPPHPAEEKDPSGNDWTCAQLRKGDRQVLATVWVGTIHTRVVADFEVDLALRGDVNEAAFPLVIDGFFGDDGHTLGYYRNPDAFSHVRFTNLRTGSCYSVSWETMDEVVAEMKKHEAYVPRRMR